MTTHSEVLMEATMPDANSVIGCRCVWHGVPCAKPATQEDGYCDWCGTRRPEDMRNNPFAMWSPEGEFLGLGGGTVTGYNHQAGWDGIPEDVRPTACWMERREQ
jgi:hypothetical protein